MILIRADANKIIGVGHVMRCLSIGHEISKKGEDVLFVTADHDGDGLIHQNGFESICLNSNWANMDDEIADIKRVLLDKHPSLFFIDSYYVTQKYFKEIKNYVKTVYMDDLNSAIWDVDYLINYNIFSLIFDYSIYESTNTRLLLGTQYAPLRNEFKISNEFTIREEVKNIFVSAGGSDPTGITEKIIENICPIIESVSFHFIVGPLNPRKEHILEIADHVGNAVIHVNEKNMSDLMKTCDVAVSASGSTLYELCAVGIPTITYSLADNQLMATEEFAKQGILLSIGDCRENKDFVYQIREQIKMLCDDRELRLDLSSRMRNIVDGRGAERIVDALTIEH